MGASLGLAMERGEMSPIGGVGNGSGSGSWHVRDGSGGLGGLERAGTPGASARGVGYGGEREERERERGGDRESRDEGARRPVGVELVDKPMDDD